jgi:vacuolar protein sorting-associated protein IST1
VEKYGKEFALAAMDNSDGKVAERVLKKLRVEPPDPELVQAYLEEIARTYGIRWPYREETPEFVDDDDEPSGGDKVLELPLPTEELVKATPPKNLGPRSPVTVAPPSPSTDNIHTTIKLPGPPELKPGSKMNAVKKSTISTVSKPSGTNGDSGGDGGGIGGKIPDVSELARRFAELKK